MTNWISGQRKGDLLEVLSKLNNGYTAVHWEVEGEGNSHSEKVSQLWGKVDLVFD